MAELERTVNRWGLGEQLKLRHPAFKVVARRGYGALPPGVRVSHGRSLSPAAAVALADGLREAADWTSGDSANLWTCHVCGDERPDALIAVYSETNPILAGRTALTTNVRYCADRAGCRNEAPAIAARWAAPVLRGEG